MRASRIAATTITAAAVGLAAACGASSATSTATAPPTPSQSQSPPAPPSPPAPRPDSVIGFTGPGVPQSYAAVTAFSRAIGRPVNVAMYYSGWYEKFQTAFAETALGNGAEVMVNAAPAGALAAIAAGGSDGYLRSLAAQIRAFGRPVILAFGHEANGDWYSYGYTHQPAAEYIAAYRHVHDVITSAGATNITWLWTVNIPDGAATSPPSAVWPGSAYVTEIGIDGYDWTGKKTFAQEFAPTITAVRKLSAAPVVIAETSVIHGPDAAAQVKGLINGIRAYGLVGMVWFNTNKSAYKRTSDRHDWELQGYPPALAAFRSAVRSLRS